MSAAALPNFNPTSSAGGGFASGSNRSINIVGTGLPDGDSLARLMAIANGPSANGGFTGESNYSSALVRTSDVNTNKWTPYILVGGLIVAAILVLRS